MSKLNHKLNGSILKFFNFGQIVSWVFREYFTSKAYQQITRENSLLPAKISKSAF